MRKLIEGIIDFRKNSFPSKREIFKRLAMGQSPDALFITCSDSRVAPNWFASTDPGDLFVIRNVGNLVPHFDLSASESSVAAAIEFAINNLHITDVIICGHSECGAMHALHNGIDQLSTSNLKHWLAHGEASKTFNDHGVLLSPELTPQNRLSQINVIKQIRHLESHPLIAEQRIKNGLRLHAWWFNIIEGAVYAYDAETKQFVLICEHLDDATVARIRVGLPL
jgi:carbonic anhydrase